MYASNLDTIVPVERTYKPLEIMPQLSPTQSRLQDDLRGQIEGDVSCDETTVQLFSTDASLFEFRPMGVVWPKSTADVVATVKYAHGRNIPIHPRGAGTGTSGGALGEGLVLDFTRYMRRMIKVDDESVLVQPGAVRMRLNSMMRRARNRIFGPDGGFYPATTIGSLLACDGAGPHWIKYGSPRNHLLSLQVVLAGGEVLELGTSDHVVGETEKHLCTKIREILEPESRAIEIEQSDLSPDRCGYRLEGVLSQDNSLPGGVNLARLITGSEGTLAIITEARLKTVPFPSQFGGALFLFDSLERAARAVAVLAPHRPSSCEMIDRRRINMVRDWDKRVQSLLPKETEAVIFVEIDDEQAQDVSDRLNEIVDDLRSIEHLCFGSIPTFNREELGRFRELIFRGDLSLARMPASVRAVPLFDDVSVPIDKLPPFLVLVQNIFKRNDVTASYSGHIGHGHLKINPIINASDVDAPAVMRKIAAEVLEEVVRQGGSISCDGACGWIRSQFLAEQNRFLYPLFGKIKSLFDPNHLFNPGKVVSNNDISWQDNLKRPFNQKRGIS